MARVATVALALFAIPLAAQQPIPADAPFRPNLVPWPVSIEPRGGGLRLGPDMTVTFAGFREGRLDRAVERYRLAVARRKPESESGSPVPLRIDVSGGEVPGRGGSPDESYHLSVTAAGISLRSVSPVGALHGLETLLQLTESDRGGLAVPAVEIDDQPRYPWRGLLLDVGRHFEPVEAVKRQLDAMAAAKLNVLHWHLSEDQGFPIESRRFPRLQQRGGTRGYYTQAEVKGIVAFAADRGIRVVPEFDMPGHATSWFVGYPALASAPGPYRLETRFGVFRPAFDPTREDVYRFLDAFIGEMSTLFPDPFWHIGGDEVMPHDWLANRRIRRFMAGRHLAKPADLQAYFNGRLAAILAKHGKRMIGWDEILEGHLGPGTVVQSWRGEGSLAAATARGFAVIQSYGLYLDHIKPAEDHYAVDPVPAGYPGDPAAIWGGEACMWGEQISATTVDSRIWPRALAVAERLWSPRGMTDPDDYYRRAEAVSRSLAERGLTHEHHSATMLAVLAPAAARAPLAALLEVAVPVSFSERSDLQRPLAGTAHDRLVDVAEPDAWKVRRTLARLVDRFLADTARRAGRDSLTAFFESWRDIAARIGTLDPAIPLVTDALPAAATLGEAGAAGLAALESLATRRPMDPVHSARAPGLLDLVARPAGLLRLDIRPGYVKLIKAALAEALQP